MTKTEKIRLARDIRRSMSYYMLFLRPHIQEQHPDWRLKMRKAVREAQRDVDRLYEEEHP